MFADSDHVVDLRTRKSTSSSKLCYGADMLHSFSTTRAVTSVSLRETEFYDLVLDAASMFKGLEVDICKSTELGQAVLEVRIDVSAGRDVTVR